MPRWVSSEPRVECTFLRVLLGLVRHLGGWVAPRIEGDAAIAARPGADLGLETAAVLGVFVDKDDRLAGAGLLDIEPTAAIRH
jgi:hypothetical protein